jgi:hypothetical protein
VIHGPAGAKIPRGITLKEMDGIHSSQNQRRKTKKYGFKQQKQRIHPIERTMTIQDGEVGVLNELKITPDGALFRPLHLRVHLKR